MSPVPSPDSPLDPMSAASESSGPQRSPPSERLPPIVPIQLIRGAGPTRRSRRGSGRLASALTERLPVVSSSLPTSASLRPSGRWPSAPRASLAPHVNDRLWAEISLDAIAHNFRLIRDRVGGRVGVCAVVKADAYGHGAIEVANRLTREGAAGFAVADVYEAIALRDAGVTAPVLTLYAPLPDEAPALVATGAAVGVGAPELCRALDRAAAEQGTTCAVHLNIDTGMGRGGCAPDDALMLAIVIARCPHLRLAGAFTHFAAVSAFDPDTTLVPFHRFSDACDRIEAAGFRLRTRHAANSAALFIAPRTHAAMVRPGVALFGIDPGPLATAGVKLVPALTLRARVIAVNRIPAGTTIGYRPGFTAYKDTRVAVIPIGYADGYPYCLADRGRVLIHGRSARVVGQISMDCTAVDVGEIPSVRVGDVVTLVGSDGDQRVSIEELAEGVGTIPYEIATRIGSRATRRFV